MCVSSPWYSSTPTPRRSPRLANKAASGTESLQPPASGLAGHLHAALAAAIYFFAGPTLIYLNHQMLRSYAFPHPIALSALGVIVSSLVSHALLRLRVVPFAQPELVGCQRFYLTRSLPIGMLSALTLALGNMAYAHLSVAACQILKTLTPVITLCIGAAVGVESMSPKLMACVVAICAGTMLASSGELTGQCLVA